MRGSFINLVILIATLWCGMQVYAFGRNVVRTAEKAMTQVIEVAK